MRDIWVISDTHFFHENILKFKDNNTGKPIRPGFADISHMNEHIIENWNSRVKPGDKVYHLGDVFMGDKEKFAKLWPRLNGSKRLIVGNHDDVKFLSSGGFFAKITMWRMFKEFGLMLTHVPIHDSGLYRGAKEGSQMLNVHGHIHQNKSPAGPYKNVSVEAINYTPVNIETLRII